MAPPGMPKTTSTPSFSSAATSAWAPVIVTGAAGSSPGRRWLSGGVASLAGARAARSRGDGAWPWRGGFVPSREPTVVVVWSVIANVSFICLGYANAGNKKPLLPRAVGVARADYQTSAIRAPRKYENVATLHVVHCGPWAQIRQPENSFVSEYEIEPPRAQPRA